MIVCLFVSTIHNYFELIVLARTLVSRLLVPFPPLAEYEVDALELSLSMSISTGSGWRRNRGALGVIHLSYEVKECHEKHFMYFYHLISHADDHTQYGLRANGG